MRMLRAGCRFGAVPRIVGAFAFAICAARVGFAQRPASMSQLDGRVSPTLRAQVAAIADSVAALGLPVAPLVDKTLEGASKGADDRRILGAVRVLAADLGVARRALGVSSSGEELTAAVAALRSGVPSSTLTDMRHSLPQRSLVVPLSVLSSLVIQGTPVPAAAMAVVTYTRHGDDSHLLVFGNEVARYIASGVAPIQAISSAEATAGTTALEHSGHPTSAARRPKP